MKFLKYLLIFVLVITLLVVLTIISWWKDWPLFSGLVIIGGIFFLILLGYGVKKLWQLKNKKKFISAIFNQQAKIDKENEDNKNILGNLSATASEINTAWKQGMQYFQQSNLRFSRRPEYAQSWFLVLDDRHLNNAKNIEIFDNLGNNLSKNNNGNNAKNPLLSWHFLNSSVLLHTGLLNTDSDADNTAWNELLTLLSSRGKSALKGVIFSIDIQTLQDLQDTQTADNNVDNLENNKQKLTKLSQAMRERLNTLMLAINKNIPVYYICNGLENISGFTDWLNRLPNEVLDEVYLGMINNSNNNSKQNFHEKSSKIFGIKNNNDANLNEDNIKAINNHNLFTADNLLYHLQSFIRQVIDKNALEGIPPRGDDLMLIVKLEKIIKNLFTLFSFTFRENSHLITPILRGSFFCARAKNYAQTGKTAFLNAVVNNILISEPNLSKDLNTKYSLKATTKTICYLSFLGILFTFCGLVAVHTLYQNKTLNKLQTYQRNFTNTETNNQYLNVDKNYYKLNKDLQEILFLENANDNWWLPKFGVNILEKIIAVKREKFIVQAMDYVVNPILNLNRDFKYTNNDSTQQDSNYNIPIHEQEQIDKIVVLDWFGDKIANIKNGKLTLNSYLSDDNVGTAEPFPINNALKKVWTPITDDIIIATLYWANREDKLHNYSILNNIKKDLSTQFSMLAYAADSNNFQLMQPMLDTFSQRLNATDTCLSDFWMHIVPKSQNDFCIPSIYTAKVANYLEEMKGKIITVANSDLDDSDSNSENDDTQNNSRDLLVKNYKRGFNKSKLEQDSNEFLNTYYLNYERSWKEFVLHFSDTLKDANNKDIFIRHTNFKTVKDMPYLKLLKKMVIETDVLKNMNQPPKWLAAIGRLNILITILGNLDNNIKDGDLSVLLNIAYNTPDSLKELRAVSASNEEMFELIKTLPNLKKFFDDVLRLSNSLQSSEQSLEIVTSFYSGNSKYIDDTKNNTTNNNNDSNNTTEKNSEYNANNLYKNAEDFIATISSKYDDKNSPQLVILRDMLNLLSTGLVIQSANEIQRLWENEVLNTPVYRLHKDNAEALFGDNGIVQMFATKHLQPFITWRDGNPMANVWENQVFPLTDDFLSILRNGEQVVLNKPQDKYKISIYTQPTIVNAGAKVLPNATKIVLDCKENQQEILNRNYPLARTFEFEPKLCSAVNITVMFPQFELQHKFDSFGEFIAAFQEGEITLYAESFANQQGILKEANINEVKLKILPDNTQNFLADQDMILPNLPDRITYTW